jgi:hypothetical protein
MPGLCWVVPGLRTLPVLGLFLVPVLGVVLGVVPVPGVNCGVVPVPGVVEGEVVPLPGIVEVFGVVPLIGEGLVGFI